MHVETKRIVYTGFAVALSVACIVLGNVIESNTLFLVSLASYFIGFIIRAFGIKTGATGWIATVILGMIVVPNKFYVATYAGLGFYIVFIELFWNRLAKLENKKYGRAYFWCAKYVVFNLMFIPTVFLFPELLMGREISGVFLVAIIACGQLGLFLYDSAYEYFMRKSGKWNRIN